MTSHNPEIDTTVTKIEADERGSDECIKSDGAQSPSEDGSSFHSADDTVVNDANKDVTADPINADVPKHNG
jgi:hypothetical protein